MELDAIATLVLANGNSLSCGHASGEHSLAYVDDENLGLCLLVTQEQRYVRMLVPVAAIAQVYLRTP
jgi:hypothetical protein